VVLRLDPFDLETIRVYYQEKRYPDARPLDLNVNREKRAEQMPDPEQGLMYSYLMALKERHEDRLRHSLGGTQFSRLFPSIVN